MLKDIKKISEIDKRKHFEAVKRDLKTSGHKFLGEEKAKISGYCMKCQKIREVDLATKVEFKNKLRVNIGQCSICGTEIYKTRS